jgi:alkyl sulfatase BDS1-like metallo-beta-lactamase superfamily hydrolase
MPSRVTIESRNSARATPPFADERDFEEAKEGCLADTEAPVEMNTYFPPRKAFWAA